MYHGVVKQDGDTLSLTTTDEDEEETVPFEINTKNSFVEFGYTGGYLSVAQLKLITEYLKTPISQREEEKKYYVKVPDSCPHCHKGEEEYCTNGDEDTRFKPILSDIYVEADEKVLVNSDYEFGNITAKINYCPMCGRKL